MVLSPTAQRPAAGQPVGGRARASAASVAPSRAGGVIRRGAGLEERRAVQRPGRPADGCHEPMADGPQQLAGGRLGGQLREQRVDGPEADDEVVAVVAVAEDGVERVS